MERGTVTALERERAHRPAGLYLLVTAQEIRVLHRGMCLNRSLIEDYECRNKPKASHSKIDRVGVYPDGRKGGGTWRSLRCG